MYLRYWNSNCIHIYILYYSLGIGITVQVLSEFIRCNLYLQCTSVTRTEDQSTESFELKELEEPEDKSQLDDKQ